MTLRMRIHLALWGVLVFLVAVGAVAFHLSSTPAMASLVLSPSQSVNVSMFRLLPDTVRISLEFERTAGQKRFELGNFTVRGDWKSTGVLEFPDPGDPIKLLLRNETQGVVYEALPGGSSGTTTINRELVPFVDDGNPHLVPWPPNYVLRSSLPSGYSNFTISVVEIGQSLAGERVNVRIEPPISFKTVAPHYGFLWWFMFWPVYAFVLAVYGAILLWHYRGRSPTNHSTAPREKLA